MLYSSGISFSYNSMGHSNWLALHGVNLNLKIVWAACSFRPRAWSSCLYRGPRAMAWLLIS